MHIPVLLHETLDALQPRSGGCYLDGTIGGGGHAEEILKASSPNGRLLGLDRDPDAIARCSQRLAPYGDRAVLVHSDFASLAQVANQAGFSTFDGILFDLGVSSFQLDEPDRGFSFLHEGPLDMRMDCTKGKTAADWIAGFGDDWHGLAQLLSDFGEEPQAGRIARAILEEQNRAPITTTKRLADIIEKAVGGRRGSPRHPATCSFQALRIAVNAEFDQIKTALEAALERLAPNGVLAVISFHSMEDRIVKNIFRNHEGRMVSLPQGGVRYEGQSPRIVRLNRHTIPPSKTECAENPRARSAKLRAVRRIED
ncbi:MAG: 16S rRNA (cytosine(1402)-N(4))-methyltransferase RsmH [Kiritimatiellia bacterium]